MIKILHTIISCLPKLYLIDITNRVFTIPSEMALTDEQVERVAQALMEILK